MCWKVVLYNEKVWVDGWMGGWVDGWVVDGIHECMVWYSGIEWDYVGRRSEVHYRNGGKGGVCGRARRWLESAGKYAEMLMLRTDRFIC